MGVVLVVAAVLAESGQVEQLLVAILPLVLDVADGPLEICLASSHGEGAAD